MPKNREKRSCNICEETFEVRKGQRFDTICPRCVKENDNQTLEAALAVPPDDREPDFDHRSTCRKHIDEDLECSCGADDIDTVALDFHEAENG